MKDRKKIISIIVTICMMVTMFNGMTIKANAAVNIVNNSLTSNSTFNNVAFGNGMFLASATNGNISKSIDGINWTILSTSTPKFTKLIFAANGTFTAIDGTTSTVYSSPDGVTWISTNISIIPQELKEANGKLFVWRCDTTIVDYLPVSNTKLLYSQDGVTWTDTKISSTGPILGMQSLSDITYGNGKYVVAAANATFYTSTNLSNWTTLELTNIVINSYGSMWPNIYNVTFLNGRFFAYGDGGSNVLMGTPINKVLTSTDGSNWTVDSSWDNNRFYGGKNLNSINILYGDNGRIYHCNNSSAPLNFLTWTISDTKNSFTFSNIAYGNGKYVALGSYGIVASSDLINWYNVNGNLKNIVYDGNGRYVAVGYNGSFGYIYNTADWTTWADVTPSRIRGSINAITYGSGSFMAVTNKVTDDNNVLVNALVLTSTNGSTWSMQDSGIKANLTGVAYNGTNTYALVTNDGHTFSSTNGGTSWTQQYSNSSYIFNTIAYLNNQFIAVGAKVVSGVKVAIVIAKSSDGINWETPIEINNDTKCNMMGIAYSGSQYILVGSCIISNKAKGAIYKSQDLTSWENVPVDTLTLNSISFGNGGFIAAGNGGNLLSSVNGDTWNTENSNSVSNFYGMTYANNFYSIVGSGFSKMRMSLPTITNSTISPVTGNFDKNSLKQKDVDTEMTLNGNSLISIKNGDNTLDSGTDYAVNSDIVTIKSSYLAQQNVGTTTLTLNFSAGNSQSLTIKVVNTAPPADATFTADVTEATYGNVKVTINYPVDAEVKKYSLDGTNYSDYTVPIEFSNNGKLYAKSQRTGGDWSNITQYDVTNIDKTAPNLAVITNKDNYTDSNWYNQKQTITASFTTTSGCGEKLQYKVDDAAWTDGESVEINAEGKYAVSFRVIDELGRASDAQTVKVNIDKTAPTDAKITIKDREFTSLLNTITFGIFFKETVNVVISADSNISGVSKVEYQKVAKESDYNPNGTWNSGSSFNASPDEKFIVYARITDNANNYTIINSDGIIVDSTTPSLTLTPDANGWSTKNVNVKVAVSDELSGVKEVTYSTNEVVPQTGTVSIINGEGTIVLTNEGQYKLTVVAKDNSLNEADQTADIKIDKTLPIITSVTGNPSNWTKDSVTLTANASDALSGLDVKAYSFDGGITWQEANSKTYDDNTNDIVVKVKDASGNIATNSTINIIKIDKTMPQVAVVKDALNYTDSNWYNQKQTITASFTTTSGCGEKLQYKVDDAAWTDGESVEINAEGKYAVSFRVIDELGRASNVQTVNVNIDKTKPTIAGVSESLSYFIGRVIKLTDDFGEIADATCKNGTDSETTLKDGDLLEKVGKYTLTLRDKAGNSNTLSFEIKALPTVEDVLYKTDCKALIDSIRAEFSSHNDLPEQYKVEVESKISALEGKYSELNQEVMAIKNETSIIKGKIDNIPSGVDGLLNLMKEIQDEYNKIASSNSALTSEQKTALENEAEYLQQKLNIIASLQNQIEDIKAQISNIQTKEDGLISQEGKITGLLSDIGKLTKEQQNILEPQIDLLNSLLDKINILKEQVNTLKEMIKSLPAVDKIAKQDSENINKIYALYSNFTNEQKELLGSDSITKFNDSIGQIRRLMLHDDKTDTTITDIDGNLSSPDIYLIVNLIAEDSNAIELSDTAKKVENAWKTISELKEKELVALYDVSLFRENVKIQPDGKIKVKIRIPENLRNRTGLDIVHIANDGKVTIMNATVEGEYLIFVTDHLSEYAIVAKSITKEIPKTGSSVDFNSLEIGGLLLMLFGIVLMRRQSRKILK